MAKKPVTSRAGRFLKLAGMTASVAGQYAGQRARRLLGTENEEGARSESYTRMAGQIAETLGELKGAVMKVGQIASQTQDFLPREFSEALEKLQREAPPMPFEVIAEQIETELGKSLGELFEYIQDTPYASASIGQVHRARLHDGTDVIVKVQYPGVDESCDSDLKQLRLTLRLGGLLKMPKASVDQLFAEIRERLKEELDYENEARNIRLFRRFHQDQPWVRIPAVIDSHSTRRVLTLELVEGDHVSQVTPDRYDQATINLIGHRIFTLMADQLFRFQCIHGDPHAGNFAYRPDGTVILYDFGCVKKLKPEIVEAYRKALIAALNEDYEALDRHLIDLGARVEDQPAVDEAYYAMWRDILIVPFLDDQPYDFGEADIHKRVAAKTSTVFQYLNRFQPPVESLFIDRMIAGHYWMLKRLGVQAAFRPDLERYLSDHAGSP
ncbi:AarF/ABC1/UbiB kinase family protein [Marinobacter lutaoensis]|jgi:predicted unusual protein kinase regulating ubiquinone biosynthesis (AarF/ABC1/UbiB family)|uniref:Protein kinase n=1 Tax=Marinobacter lutaoensis TaxID=135739 RepID=A0A1V2DWR6_9GAMM|nr:AarF/ABC1/UbiB kinase family protein [Marinobacter lutaoensis]MBE02835.1 protein kinase [Marinobacter sp.]MBI42922.1 protein kinase [Oceanospirillales bacterium]NVD34865.1 AarF/ABC1/UbiB kinase family protein [Marinobacter lutaoensis]ONF44900.1 protein kinase [Marinobacter lutaoensis]|tara:strand:+ start:4017 stop:5336 length:1320 start_codon:yes stop_codon:yes gene_type:complete